MSRKITREIERFIAISKEGKSHVCVKLQDIIIVNQMSGPETELDGQIFFVLASNSSYLTKLSEDKFETASGDILTRVR